MTIARGRPKFWLYKFCKVEDCNKHSESKEGFCFMHLRRLRRNGTTNRVHIKQGTECIIKECRKKPHSRQMCDAHYSNWLRYKDPLHKRTMKKETRKKISKTTKGRPVNREALLKSFKTLHSKPTMPERKLLYLIEQNKLPFKFCGLGDVIIADKFPDFININGKKQLIEVYGDYWHRNDNPQDRIDLFKQYGFDTLIIWEHELKDEDTVLIKVKEFLLH